MTFAPVVTSNPAYNPVAPGPDDDDDDMPNYDFGNEAGMDKRALLAKQKELIGDRSSTLIPGQPDYEFGLS